MNKRFKEFEEAEHNGTLLPDGRICKKEMIRFIEHCTTMSTQEREQFIKALNGEKDKKGRAIKFPYPADSVAREQIIETIKNMAARKLPQYEYDAQPTLGVHVMAGSGEDYRKNIEFLFKVGSWDKNTTYAGHIAEEYPEAWSATLDKSKIEISKIEDMLRKSIKELDEEVKSVAEKDPKRAEEIKKEIEKNEKYLEDIENILVFIDSLKDVKKGTVVEMPTLLTERGNKALYDHFFYNIENEIGELRSYDGQVMLDVARQIMQAHYAYANEFADFKYIEALDFVSSHYDIVKVANTDYAKIFSELGLFELREDNELVYFDKNGKLREDKIKEIEAKLEEMLNKGDEFAEKLVFAGLGEFNKENIESIKYFLDKYDYVDSKVRTKQTFTLFEGPITNFIELDENGVIKNVKGLKILDELKGHEDEEFVREFIDKINSWEGKTLAQYAKEISEFRAEHITDFVDFVQKYDIKPDNWELANGFIRMMQQTNDLLSIGIYFPWKVNNDDQQWTFRGKNNNMAFNLAEFAQTMSIQDALVGLMYGQEIYDRNMACEYMERRRRGNIQLNPTMLVPGADRTSPSAFAYGYAQDVWMNVTQKALSGLLTFYGKGIGDYHFAGTIIHTGEDSFMFMIERSLYNLQKRNQNTFAANSSSGLRNFSSVVGYRNTISSERLEYRTFLWQRPAAYSGGTEQRYLWNVMLYLTEGTARNINFGDSSLGYDVKVANSMLWQHYLNIPLVSFMLTAFSVLIFFSSFAHLLPFIASVGITVILMMGINFGGVIFATSQTDGIMGMGLTFKRIVQLLPYFNSMFGTFMEGFTQGIRQMFGFTPTKKNLNYQTDSVEGMAKTYSKQVQFGTRVFLWLGLAIATFIFLVSIGSPVNFVHFLISFFAVTIFYFAAGIANITGPNAYRAKVTHGTVKGSRIPGFFIKTFASIPLAPIVFVAFIVDTIYMFFTNKSFMVNLNANEDIKNVGLLEKWFSFCEHGTKGRLERNIRKQLNLETINKALGNKERLMEAIDIVKGSEYDIETLINALRKKGSVQDIIRILEQDERVFLPNASTTLSFVANELVPELEKKYGVKAKVIVSGDLDGTIIYLDKGKYNEGNIENEVRNLNKEAERINKEVKKKGFNLETLAVNMIILDSGFSVEQIRETLASKDSKEIAKLAEEIIASLATAVKKDKSLTYETLFFGYKPVDAQWTIESDLSYSMASGYKSLMNVYRLRKLNILGAISTKYYVNHYEALVKDGVISREYVLLALLEKYSKTERAARKAILKTEIEKTLETIKQEKLAKLNKDLAKEKDPKKKEKIEADIKKVNALSYADIIVDSLFVTTLKESYGILTSVYAEDRILGVKFIRSLQEIGIFNFAEDKRNTERLIGIVEEALEQIGMQISTDFDFGRAYNSLGSMRGQFATKLQAQQDLKDLLSDLRGFKATIERGEEPSGPSDGTSGSEATPGEGAEAAAETPAEAAEASVVDELKAKIDALPVSEDKKAAYKSLVEDLAEADRLNGSKNIENVRKAMEIGKLGAVLESGLELDTKGKGVLYWLQILGEKARIKQRGGSTSTVGTGDIAPLSEDSMENLEGEKGQRRNDELSEAGLEDFVLNGTLFGAFGGLASRLSKPKGPRVEMYPSEYQGKSYLEIMFINKINEMVDVYYRKCEEEGKQPKKSRGEIYKILPLMTSPNTQDYLKQDFIDLGYEVTEDKDGLVILKWRGGKDNVVKEVYLMNQSDVPAITDFDGNLAYDEKGGVFKGKPGGHGDIHYLMKIHKVFERLEECGIDNITFVQDNVGTLNAVLAMVGKLNKDKRDFVVATVASKPGEAAGRLFSINEKGRVVIGNVEYSDVTDLKNGIETRRADNYAKFSEGKTAEEVAAQRAADDEFMSKLVGTENVYANAANINAFTLSVAAYRKAVDLDLLALFNLFNPKTDGEGATLRIKSPASMEGMAQGIWNLMSNGAVLNYAGDDFHSYIFSAIKNSILSDSGKEFVNKKETTTDVEVDYANGEVKKITDAVRNYRGDKASIEITGEKRVFNIGKKVELGARIVFERFEVLSKDIAKHFTGKVSWTNRSDTLFSGDIHFEDVEFDGAMRVTAADNAKVTLTGVFRNAGYKLTAMTPEQAYRILHDENATETEIQQAMRGLAQEKISELDIKIDNPGEYVVEGQADGTVVVYKIVDGKRIAVSQYQLVDNQYKYAELSTGREDINSAIEALPVSESKKAEYRALVEDLAEADRLNGSKNIENVRKAMEIGKLGAVLESGLELDTKGKGVLYWLQILGEKARIKQRGGSTSTVGTGDIAPLSEDSMENLEGEKGQRRNDELSEAGLEDFVLNGTLFGAFGGLASRLSKPKGPRVEMYPSEYQGKSYLEIMFINKINEMVDVYYRKCEEEGKQPKKSRGEIYKILPLMTSPNTQDYLKQDFIDLGYEVTEDKDGLVILKWRGGKDNVVKEVYLMNQSDVPAITDFDGNLAYDEKGGVFKGKPGGHGDIHYLMKIHKVFERLEECGIDNITFVQDNVGTLNAVLAMVGKLNKDKRDFVVATVASKPGEAAGRLFSINEKGRVVIGNVEYSDVTDLKNGIETRRADNYAKFSEGKTAEEVAAQRAADDEFMSKLVGTENVYANAANINAFTLSVAAYRKAVDLDLLALFNLFNPKTDGEGATLRIKSPASMEGMAQGIWNLMSNGAVLNYAGDDFHSYIFSAIKNSILSDSGKEFVNKKETTTDVEVDYANGEVKKITDAVRNYRGDKASIEITGEKRVFNIGKKVELGARIVFERFEVLSKDIAKHFTGKVSWTNRSDTLFSGDIHFEDVEFDGAMRVTAADNAKVTLTGVFRNAGYKLTAMTPEQAYRILHDENATETEIQQAMRGLAQEKISELDIKIDNPGEYVVEGQADGTVVVYKIVDGKRVAIAQYELNSTTGQYERKDNVTPSSVAKEEAEKTVAMPSGMAAQKQAINMVFENLGEAISIKFDTLTEARESGYTKVAAVPGIFVSEQSIQEMINKGMMKQNKDKYELLDAEGKVVAIVQKGQNVLRYKNGKPVTFKFNAMAKSEGDTTINIQLHLNSAPRAIFDCLDEQTKRDLLQAAKLLLNDRLLSDPVAEDRMLKILTSDKMISENIDNSRIEAVNKQLENNIKAIRKDMSENSGYTEPELERLLRTSSMNGIKSVQRQETYLTVSPKTDIASRLNTMKNSGVTAIILRGKYSADTIKFIKNHGFDVIIEFNEKDRAKLETFVKAGLSGLRFVVKDAKIAQDEQSLQKYYDDNKEMIKELNFKTIPTISYEFDKSILSEEQLRNNVITFVTKEDKDKKAKDIELVVDVETCADNLDAFKDLAESARLVVKVDDNRNIDANSKMKEVLAKFYGVAICANKVFVTNMFRDNLKNNPRLVGRNIELNEMLKKDISTIKDLLVEGNKTITEKDLEDLFTTEAIKQIKKLLEQNKDNLSLTTVVREYILGSMIATVEKEIISSNVQAGEKNYKILVGSALIMMVNGASMDFINEMVDNIEITEDGSISQLLNGENSSYAIAAKKILGMWKSSDMTIISMDDQSAKDNKINTVTLSGLIKLVLTMDTILPENDLLNSSINVSLDGIKGILAAA